MDTYGKDEGIDTYKKIEESSRSWDGDKEPIHEK
jgi:hypothetical protein